MIILRAAHMGFCYGVKRAIKIAEEQIGSQSAIHTYGPIIHNPQVVEKLRAAGVTTWSDFAALPA